MSEQADPTYYGDDAIRYLPRGPFTNWAEKAALDAEQQWKKAAGEGENMHGMFWTIGQP